MNTRCPRIKETEIWSGSPGKWSSCLFQRTEQIGSGARERQELDKISKEPSIHRDISFLVFNPWSSGEFPDTLISKLSSWLPMWAAARQLLSQGSLMPENETWVTLILTWMHVLPRIPTVFALPQNDMMRWEGTGMVTTWGCLLTSCFNRIFLQGHSRWPNL